jgi:hypothetical protein
MRLKLIGLIKKRDAFEFQLHILRLISAVEAIDKDIRVADAFRDNPLDDPQPDRERSARLGSSRLNLFADLMM